MNWSEIDSELVDWHWIDILVWVWQHRLALEWHIVEDGFSESSLAETSRIRIVLVPLTKWGIVHWIGSSLTCLVPMERQLSSIYSMGQV